MNLLGMDLNAARLRAVSNRLGPAAALPLSGTNPELPLVLHLQGKTPEVGRRALAVYRQFPHRICGDFLPHLPDPALPARVWEAVPYRLDAAAALGWVLNNAQPLFGDVDAAVLAVPTYLSPAQVAAVLRVASEQRLPVSATLGAPLAAAMAAHSSGRLTPNIAVIDIDNHALSLASLVLEGFRVRVLDTQVLPRLGMNTWRGRLMNALSDACVRQSRRDPRDSPEAEQSLFDRFEDLLEACRQGESLQLALQSPRWFQNLIVTAEQTLAVCAGLVQQLLEQLHALLATSPSAWPTRPGLVILTHPAGRLPGLFEALQQYLALNRRAGAAELSLFVLAADALGKAAFGLAEQVLERGTPPRGHLAASVALGPTEPTNQGPARLRFHGREHLLTDQSFVLGKQPGCSLVLEGDYPGVAPRHCEISRDRVQYVLWDRSRTGTLVNGRRAAPSLPLQPGDWIRLGPGGPVLRFLGQAAESQKRTSSA
jgi:hypothetical protein